MRPGLPAYEISNHAAPGEESRHNLLYWRYGEYAGCGPGAHGRLVFGGARHATSTERTPERWARAGRGDRATVGSSRCRSSLAEQADEMLLMGLRLSEGIDLDRLAAASGQSPRAPVLAALVHDGLIERIAKQMFRRAASWPDEIKACVARACGRRAVAPPSGTSARRSRAALC